MKVKAKHIVFFIFVLVAAAFAAVYFTVLPVFTIVQDESWKLVMPKMSYVETGLSLLKNKTRLKIVTVDSAATYDEFTLSNDLAKLDSGGIVVVSPVVTASAKAMKVNVSQILTDSTVYGIGKDNDDGLFDSVLVSDDSDGWSMAAIQATQNNEISAVIYDSKTEQQAKTIYEKVDSEHMYQFNIENYGNLFVSSIMDEIEKNNISVVFCPRLEYLQYFFDEIDSTVKWVTDYRYANVVRKDNLLGVVYPDILASIESDDGILRYVYRNVERSIF